MSESKTPTLTLVTGGSTDGEAHRLPRGTIASVPSVFTIPQQLELIPSGISRDRAVIASYIFVADLENFRRILVEHGVRAVLDLRVSPSFSDRDLSRSAVFDVIRQRSGAYEWCNSLTNPFLGESWDRTAVLNRYARWLRERPGELRRVRQLIRTGPAMLLGNYRGNFSLSDVGALVDVLREEDGAFELEVIH